MTVDGVAMTLLSPLENNEARFAVNGILDKSSDNLELYFNEGLPQGYKSVIEEATLELSPQVFKVTPNTGSAGGTKITLSTAAIGTETDLTGAIVQAEIESTWTKICNDLTLEQYGTLTCTTTAMKVSDRKVRIAFSDGNTSECVNDDASLCIFKQESSANTPVVTKATVSGNPPNMMRFEGTGFTTQVPVSSTPLAYYRGVEAGRNPAASTYTDTVIEVAFPKGVPVALTADSVNPTLVFEDGTAAYTAELDNFVFEYASPVLAITEVPSELKCSFAGGCDYVITAPGLTGALQGTEDSSIEVCGNTCTFDAEKSSAAQATCTLEPLVTKYSVDTYKLAKPAVLKGTWEGSAGQAQLKRLNDGINVIDSKESGNSCEFKFVNAREGYMYSISEVRFFINGLSTNMPHVNNLKFQGSTDGSSWSDIWEVDSGIHKGWNSKNIDEVVKSFRFVGSQSGACRVGEV
jgi:hypothetical protein